MKIIFAVFLPASYLLVIREGESDGMFRQKQRPHSYKCCIQEVKAITRKTDDKCVKLHMAVE